MPMSRRSIDLAIPSEFGWERVAMEVAGTVARLMGFPQDRVDDIRTAVLETTLNAIEHGNQFDAAKPVHISLLPGNERLEINIRDRGSRHFEPPNGAPDLAAQVSGAAPRRGWGMFLARSLVDELELASTRGGHRVRMVVSLPVEQRNRAPVHPD